MNQLLQCNFYAHGVHADTFGGIADTELGKDFFTYSLVNLFDINIQIRKIF
jgi:hypothetical protein